MEFKLLNGLTVFVTWYNSEADVKLSFNGKLLEESTGDDDFDITGLAGLDSLQLFKLLENCSNLDKHLLEQIVKDEMVYIQVRKGINK